MKFGVNYVPSKNWFYSWEAVDLSMTDEDFAAIRELGADHLRLHLRWDLFQPNATYVSERMLGQLVSILSLAEKHGLEVYVSVFTGWMSGFWFLPSFMWNKNAITDESAISAEIHFLEILSKTLMPCRAFAGIDLGNEFNVYEMMIGKFSVAEGDAWLTRLTERALSLFPGKVVTLGVDHQPWFKDIQMSRSALSNCGNVTSLHTWMAFCGATQFGDDSREVMNLQEFNVELANAYAKDAKRPVWLQEFGVHSMWMSEDKFERYVHESMQNALRSENVFGFTWWCSHDVSRDLSGFHPIEYELGLLTVDNQVKPLGRYFSDCVKEIKSGKTAPKLRTGVGIVINESKPFDAWDYGHKFCRLIGDGVHPKFVLSSDADNTSLLAAKGICEIVK